MELIRKKGLKELEIFRNQIGQALMNLKYYGYDGHVFYEKEVPEMKKLEGVSIDKLEADFMKERDRQMAESNMITYLVAMYVSYITCPSDDDNNPEDIIESEYEKFRHAVKADKQKAARSRNMVVGLDAHGWEAGVPVEEKKRSFDEYRDEFLRMCEMIEKVLDKIKVNRNA